MPDACQPRIPARDAAGPRGQRRRRCRRRRRGRAERRRTRPTVRRCSASTSRDLPVSLRRRPVSYDAVMVTQAQPDTFAGADTPPRGSRPFVLAPFRGLRFDPEVVGELGTVISPPYDVLDADTVRDLSLI